MGGTEFFERTQPVLVSIVAGTLQGTYQDGRWPNNTSSLPFIKNAELVLVKAEAHAQLGQISEAVEAINIIKEAAGIGAYTGETSQQDSLMKFFTKEGIPYGQNPGDTDG